MKQMKKVTLFITTIILSVTLLSCSRVPPNYYGVLMENYGKNGKRDYSPVQGSVSTFSPGTELFLVPTFEQRSSFENILHLKASDNTEFTAKPLYSYKVNSNRVVDVVFENARLGTSDNFLKAIEDNVLEPHIYDLLKEESRKYITDSLMSNGGSLKFEKFSEDLIRKAFDEKGLTLITFSCNIDFSVKVKAKIDSRNEVNTNVTVIDQQIIEQKKRNELAILKAEENIIRSKGLTPQILQEQFIEAWKETKQPLYGNTPINKFVQ